MAGDGIGKFDLQRIKMRVVLHFHEFPELRLSFIVLHHFLVQAVRFFIGQ
jgi:hypothetical protein